MDPKACWERLCEALRDGDVPLAREKAHDLWMWLDRDGYRPASVPNVEEAYGLYASLIRAETTIEEKERTAPQNKTETPWQEYDSCERI